MNTINAQGASLGLSRRNFIGGMTLTAFGLAGAATASLAGCASGTESACSSFAEGSFTSTQKTPYATAEVSCTFNTNGLTDVTYEVVRSSVKDYFPVYESAVDDYCAAIVEAGKTEGVDTVSGATFCSEAIKMGVDACMAQALGMPAASSACTANPQDENFDSFDGDCAEVFSPIKLGSMEIANRVIKSAGSAPWADRNGDKLSVSTELYGSMAQNGVALILLAGGALGGTGILPDSLDKIEGSVEDALATVVPLVDAVHAAGGKLGFQMCYGGLAPSVPDSVINETPVSEFDAFIERVGISAQRSKQVGFDCIEIKGASADALNGFLTRRINKREDEYGPQSIENRSRLFCRMIAKIKEVNGADYPVGALINAVEENDVELGNNDLFLTIDESKEIAKTLVAAGADWIQVRVGTNGQEMNIWAPDVQHSAFGANGMTGYDSMFNYKQHFGGLVDGTHSGFGSFLPMVKAIKEAVDVPVGCAACVDLRMGPDFLNQAISNGELDLVFMNRPLNCDPELVSKMKEHRREDVRPCMKCMHCHDNQGTKDLKNKVPSSCRMNATYRNSLTDVMPDGAALKPAETKRNIMVIGAGPAGMEAARVAAERGHSVTLYDAESNLGGLIPFARGVKGGHERFDDYLTYISAQLDHAGVNIQLNTMVDSALVKEQAPDAVVVATGGLRESKFSGDNVFAPKDAFSPTALGERVVILGAGVQAIDFASFLVSLGKSVTIVNPKTSDDLDKGQSGWFRVYALAHLRSAGVKIWNDASIDGVDESSVTITTATGIPQVIPCDSVVEFYDMVPNPELAEELEAAGFETYAVGDCAEPHNIQKAVLAGHMCARSL